MKDELSPLTENDQKTTYDTTKVNSGSSSPTPPSDGGSEQQSDAGRSTSNRSGRSARAKSPKLRRSKLTPRAKRRYSEGEDSKTDTFARGPVPTLSHAPSLISERARKLFTDIEAHGECVELDVVGNSVHKAAKNMYYSECSEYLHSKNRGLRGLAQRKADIQDWERACDRYWLLQDDQRGRVHRNSFMPMYMAHEAVGDTTWSKVGDEVPYGSLGLDKAKNGWCLTFFNGFMGTAPNWFKYLIGVFMLVNVLVRFVDMDNMGPKVAGWLVVLEFIFCLAMAFSCYPLQPGGLIVIEAIALGLTNPEAVYLEVEENLPVLLLLMFMVSAIYFMKDMLLFIFTWILVKIPDKTSLSVFFLIASAVLSGFLDALTVMVVVISVVTGFYSVYDQYQSDSRPKQPTQEIENILKLREDQQGSTMEQFKGFLRTVLMHSAMGTALGGACTLVGEPQNLLIGKELGWEFNTFFMRVVPVSMPVFLTGLLVVVLLEKSGTFAYGVQMPGEVRAVLSTNLDRQWVTKTRADWAGIFVQGIGAFVLVISLVTQLMEPGFVGIFAIIVVSIGNGTIREASIGKAFEESMPFVTLLIVFFGVVSVIQQQGLFKPIIEWLLNMSVETQAPSFYLMSGILSTISDNVFVAAVYMQEIRQSYCNACPYPDTDEEGCEVVFPRRHFERLAVSTNMGTNILSVATPNGQAAFLFLLTSAIAPIVGLSYKRMIYMSLPHFVVLTLMGLMAIMVLLDGYWDTIEMDDNWVEWHEALCNRSSGHD